MGKRKRAAEALKLAITNKPNFAEARLNLGVLCLMLNKRNEAWEQYRQLRNLGSDLANTLFSNMHANRTLDVRQMENKK